MSGEAVEVTGEPRNYLGKEDDGIFLDQGVGPLQSSPTQEKNPEGKKSKRDKKHLPARQKRTIRQPDLTRKRPERHPKKKGANTTFEKDGNLRKGGA